MNQAELTELAQKLLLIISPLIAGGALAKIGKNTSDRTTELLGRAWGVLQRRFSGDEAATMDLERYSTQPENANRKGIIVELIVRHFQSDASAIAELRALIEEFSALGPEPQLSQVRQVYASGNAQIGQVLQGDIQGNLTFGPVDFNRKTIVAPSASTTPAPTSKIQYPTPTLPAILSADGVHFSYGHALLVGVGDYKMLWLSCGETRADAERLAITLRDPAIAAYPAEQVQVLKGSAATRANILAALDGLAARLKQAPQPTVVLFFAGHGELQGNDYVLLPHDYNPSDKTRTTISAAMFREKVEAIAALAQKLLIVLNCCHSGGVGDGTLDASEVAVGDSPPPSFYAPLAEGSGRVIISSSRPAQKSGACSSVDPELTTFGAHLIAALSGKGPGSGPAVTVFELFSHLAARVPTDARTITYKKQPLEQNPLLFARAVDQDFAVALRPTGQRGGTLDTNLAEVIQRLAALEFVLASYPDEHNAPSDLVSERDALLKRLDL